MPLFELNELTTWDDILGPDKASKLAEITKKNYGEQTQRHPDQYLRNIVHRTEYTNAEFIKVFGPEPQESPKPRSLKPHMNSHGTNDYVNPLPYKGKNDAANIHPLNDFNKNLPERCIAFKTFLLNHAMRDQFVYDHQKHPGWWSSQETIKMLKTDTQATLWINYSIAWSHTKHSSLWHNLDDTWIKFCTNKGWS